MAERPSDSEIIKKITDAIKAITEEKRTIPESKHFVSDQDDLGITDTKDLWPLLLVLLEEIKVLGPKDCYVGGRPPQKSYETKVKGKELWAYSWESVQMGKRMYLKFCLVKDWYFYMGCHNDNPPGATK